MPRLQFCVLFLTAFITGCAAPNMQTVYDAYNRQDYQASYAEAQRVEGATSGYARAEASYMAGLSAYRLNSRHEAIRYLEAAAEGSGRIAGDACATLGLIHSEDGHYDRAAGAFVNAANHYVPGEDRARAAYYAGIAYRKLGRRAESLTWLAKADENTHDASLRQRINQDRYAGAWAVQTGAFTHAELARKQADELARRAAYHKLPAPEVITASRGVETLYLVQVGTFYSYENAVAARDRLAPTAVIVPRAEAK